jgi:hypothetical protein
VERRWLRKEESKRYIQSCGVYRGRPQWPTTHFGRASESTARSRPTTCRRRDFGTTSTNFLAMLSKLVHTRSTMHNKTFHDWRFNLVIGKEPVLPRESHSRLHFDQSLKSVSDIGSFFDPFSTSFDTSAGSKLKRINMNSRFTAGRYLAQGPKFSRRIIELPSSVASRTQSQVVTVSSSIV